MGSYLCTELGGTLSAYLIIRWVSYNKNPENKTSPPYNDTEYKLAPRADVTGTNMDPRIMNRYTQLNCTILAHHAIIKQIEMIQQT